MTQPRQRQALRRTPTKVTGTFTFWFRRPNQSDRIGAWMLDRDTSEAAFLAPAHEAPAVGEQIELIETCKPDPAVADTAAPSYTRLPRFCRVVRIETAKGVTRRVAVRFENVPA